MKAMLRVNVEFDSEITDAESIAYAFDKLMTMAIRVSDMPNDYGDIKIGKFYVANNRKLEEEK